MKKIFLYSSLALMAVGLASCNDFLDENRYPLVSESNSPDFWNNKANVETECNAFYDDFIGYSSGTSVSNSSFYFASCNDDQVASTFENWEYSNAPASSSYWSDPYTEIRRANYIINNVPPSSLDESDKSFFVGVARMMRAYEYFLLVKRYGDCQWINVVVDPADEETVYAPRDDRDMVMDSVLADLNFACATVTGSSTSAWSNSLAQAMKSDICLWEGTYCKYRTVSENGKAADESRAQKFLNECVTASQNVMNAGFSLCDEYQAAYNSEDLAGNSEIIFYKHYVDNVLRHSLISYIIGAQPIRGMTKDAFEAYLFKDGKPMGVSTEYADDSYSTPEISLEFEAFDATRPVWSDYSISNILAVRDKRLAQSTDSTLSLNGHVCDRGGATLTYSTTGYTVSKFDNVDLPVDTRLNNNRSYTDAPLYWLPVVYCNYAEAKAELGTITNSDLDNTINKLLARAELPSITTTIGFHDPKNDVGVSDLIWEIRRCRRCELMMDGFRYWDLIRWHMLDKMDNVTVNPDCTLGVNVDQYQAWCSAYNDAAEKWENANPGSTLTRADYSQIATKTVDGHVYVNATTEQRVYASKHYFYPIPTAQLSLNPALTQNPGW